MSCLALSVERWDRAEQWALSHNNMVYELFWQKQLYFLKFFNKNKFLFNTAQL